MSKKTGSDGRTARAPGMRRARTEVTGDAAVRRVADLVEGEEYLGWVFRPQPLPDYGIDAQAEVVAEDDLVTGQLIGLQIKGGHSPFRTPHADGWVFYEDSDHLSYWLGHSLPVVVVIVGTDGVAYWQVVNTGTVSETPAGFTMVIPREQCFDASARDGLLKVAGRSSGLHQALPSFYSLLPGDVRRSLEHAEAVDRLAVARLAAKLSEGRATPKFTAASLMAARPKWLAESAAAEYLWGALGAYAKEHGHDPEAAAAYELAAECGGAFSARARAFAGLSLMFVDRERAGDLLRRARDDGAQLLADVGLSLLDVPLDDARAVEVPQAMVDATDEELDSEPTVLNFLAEMAERRSDLSPAVEYRQRALRHSVDSSAMRLALARTLWHRAAAEGDPSPRERRETLGQVQMALEDRRRWDGPAGEALGLLVDLHITSGNLADAIHAALPVSEGGTARQAEAATLPVARGGATASLHAGNDIAYRFFLSQLPDGAELHELHAMEQEKHLSQPDRITAWQAVLTETNDDQLAVRCIVRLVHLGEWPAQADNMRARNVLPDVIYNPLMAAYRARSQDLGLGLASLRELAQTSPQAALELVLALEEKVNADEAIAECERQNQRWRDLALGIGLIELLIRHGGTARAAELVERNVDNDAFPVDVRLSWCRWYVVHKTQEGDLRAAEQMTVAGLGLSDDPDLAWNLVSMLARDGKVPQARQALVRYRPRPGTDSEVRVWLQLHLGTTVNAEDARLMVDLLRQQPEGELRDMIATLLVREVLLTPGADGRLRYPDDLVQSVRELSESFKHTSGIYLLERNDDDALREVLEREQLSPAQYEALREEVRRGMLSVADLAEKVQRPYGAALLQRPAGAIIGTDTDPAMRRAGEDAVERAVGEGTCVVDLSALHMMNLVGEDDRLRIRAAIATLVAPGSAIEDTVRTRDSMRGLAISAYTAGLRPDGTVERTTLSAAQRALLEEQAKNLEQAITVLQTERLEHSSGPAVDAITLAQVHGVPLWCDDNSLRQRARGQGVEAFSTLDLITVLERSGVAIDTSAIYRKLAHQYVIDLPLTADDVISVAEGDGWAMGAAHTALARRAWWLYRSTPWQQDWLAIAKEAAGHSPGALFNVTRAALAGALGAVFPSLATQRYQDVVVLALAASHMAGTPVAADFLDRLAAQAADARLPPRKPFVLRGLAQQLADRGVPDPYGAAMALLPGVPLP